MHKAELPFNAREKLEVLEKELDVIDDKIVTLEEEATILIEEIELFRKYWGLK